jgi:carbamate kinase
MKEANYSKRMVIALGGNAILQAGQKGSVLQMHTNLQAACRQLAPIIASWYQLVITHGNGPQVGNILIQNEKGKGEVPSMPLDICGAQSQGMLGYLIQQSLRQELLGLGKHREIAALITSTLVDSGDPAFSSPTKPIGPWLRKDDLPRLFPTSTTYQKLGDRGWRRLVASPQPLHIENTKIIETLLQAGAVVVACGGGGVPVVQNDDVRWQGVEAVIDKDLASMHLAIELKAEILLILTDVPAVFLNYGTKRQRAIERISTGELRRHLERGAFPPGSIGPKVQAAVGFVEAGGEKAIISSMTQAADALKGKCGTTVLDSCSLKPK